MALFLMSTLLISSPTNVDAASRCEVLEKSYTVSKGNVEKTIISLEKLVRNEIGYKPGPHKVALERKFNLLKTYMKRHGDNTTKYINECNVDNNKIYGVYARLVSLMGAIDTEISTLYNNADTLEKELSATEDRPAEEIEPDKNSNELSPDEIPEAVSNEIEEEEKKIKEVLLEEMYAVTTHLKSLKEEISNYWGQLEATYSFWKDEVITTIEDGYDLGNGDVKTCGLICPEEEEEWFY